MLYNFIISSLGQGGAEGQLLRLARGVADRGFRVNLLVYAMNDRTHSLDQVNLEGINVIIQNRREKYAPIRIVKAIFFIKSFMRSQRDGIFYTHLHMNNVLVRLASVFLNVKVIYGIRTSLQGYKRMYIIQHRLLFRGEKFLVNNSYNLQEFVSRGLVSEKSSYLINGFETNDQDQNVLCLRPSVFGLIGRLSTEKRFDVVVRRWSETTNQKYTLIIRGTRGNSFGIIKPFLGGAISYEGTKNVNELFDGIDAIIVSSAYEGCPNVIFEAGLKNKLVLISSEANRGDWIADCSTGFVFNDFDDLFDLLERLADMSSKNLLNIANNWRNEIMQEYTIDAMVDAFISSCKCEY